MIRVLLLNSTDKKYQAEINTHIELCDFRSEISHEIETAYIVIYTDNRNKNILLKSRYTDIETIGMLKQYNIEIALR